MEIGNLEVHLRRRQHIEGRMSTRPRLPGNLRQLGALGAVTKAGGSGSQRAIVKVLPVGSAWTRQHLSYLQYQKGYNQTRAPLYGSAANDPLSFAARTQHDPHQFRIIVSPQEHQLGDHRPAFIEALMRQMERDVGRSLDWVAADHYDTAYPHTHIALRGVANDKPLYLTKSYFEHGIRDRAEALLTRYLGPRQQERQREQLTQAYTQDAHTRMSLGQEQHVSQALSHRHRRND